MGTAIVGSGRRAAAGSDEGTVGFMAQLPRSVSIHREKCEEGIPIYGDQAIAEDVITRVAQFILKYGGGQLTSNVTRVLSSLSRTPLNDMEVILGVKIIQDYPLVQVVPNEMNDGGNGILTTHEFTMNIHDRRLLGVANRSGLIALQGADHKEEVHFLGISQQAFGSVTRYTEEVVRRLPPPPRSCCIIV